MVKYNLGSGFEVKEGFINVDLDFPDADINFDLNDDWSFAKDNSADYVLASHIFEHLHDKLHTMNELYRILKVGGIAEIHVPSTDGRGAFQDFTHTSWWNINSFHYYSSRLNPGWHALGKKYGFKGDFIVKELIDQEPIEKIIITKAVLEKR